MIRITNNIKEFLENESGEIYLYGAGNAGYWTGFYMNRCGYAFEKYIDRDIRRADATYLGHEVVSLEYLKTCTGRKIRMIITPGCYEQILAELLWMDHLETGLEILCYVPKYENIITHRKEYHINRMLGFFRRQLLTAPLPTIISNTCIAGNIYSLFDYIMLSPTINTGLDMEDFIKLCENPRYYLEKDIGELHWERDFGNPSRGEVCPVGMVDDIKIWFGHVDSEEGLTERWNLMSKKVDYQNMLFIMTGMNPPVPLLKRFFALTSNRFYISFNSNYGCDGTNGIYCPRNYFEESGSAIENYFDIVGWINEFGNE